MTGPTRRLGPISSSPALLDDGSVAFASHDQHLYIVGHDGTLKWSHATSDIIFSSPAVGTDGNGLYRFRRRPPLRDRSVAETPLDLSDWILPAARGRWPRCQSLRRGCGTDSGAGGVIYTGAMASTRSIPMERFAGASPPVGTCHPRRRCCRTEPSSPVARTIWSTRSRRMERNDGIFAPAAMSNPAPPSARTERSTSVLTTRSCTRLRSTDRCAGRSTPATTSALRRRCRREASCWSDRSTPSSTRSSPMGRWPGRSGPGIVLCRPHWSTLRALCCLVLKTIVSMRSRRTVGFAGRSSWVVTWTVRPFWRLTEPSTLDRMTRSSTLCAFLRVRPPAHRDVFPARGAPFTKGSLLWQMTILIPYRRRGFPLARCGGFRAASRFTRRATASSFPTIAPKTSTSRPATGPRPWTATPSRSIPGRAARL